MISRLLSPKAEYSEIAAEVRAMEERWYQKDLANLLWPVGGTVFGLILVPVAIAQYPQFFNENEWLLPTSVAIVVFCWCLPLVLHSRARKLYSSVAARGKLGKILLGAMSVVAIGLLYYGSTRLLSSHRNHLRALNAPKPEQPVPIVSKPLGLQETGKEPVKKPSYVSRPKHSYDLTGVRRKKFIKLLNKPQTEPRDILKIGCISWSDEACVAAGKFLILFSEAGWTIDSNRVFRLDPLIPIDGMGMVSHIDNGAEAQKLPPHLGTWQKMDASQITIWWAFKEMGIPIHPSGDQSIPLGTLGIYFGPEPR